MMETVAIVSALAAVAAAAGTFAACAVSWRIHKEDTAPEVVAYVERGNSPMLWFVLRNVGSGVAYDITFDPGDLPSRPRDIESRFAEFRAFGVPMLVPGQERRTPVYEAVQGEVIDPVTYPVTVRYAAEHGGEQATVTYYLDYKSFSNALWQRNDLSEIKNALKSINGTLGRAAVDLGELGALAATANDALDSAAGQS